MAQRKSNGATLADILGHEPAKSGRGRPAGTRSASTLAAFAMLDGSTVGYNAYPLASVKASQVRTWAKQTGRKVADVTERHTLADGTPVVTFRVDA